MAEPRALVVVSAPMNLFAGAGYPTTSTQVHQANRMSPTFMSSVPLGGAAVSSPGPAASTSGRHVSPLPSPMSAWRAIANGLSPQAKQEPHQNRYQTGATRVLAADSPLSSRRHVPATPTSITPQELPDPGFIGGKRVFDSQRQRSISPFELPAEIGSRRRMQHAGIDISHVLRRPSQGPDGIAARDSSLDPRDPSHSRSLSPRPVSTWSHGHAPYVHEVSRFYSADAAHRSSFGVAANFTPQDGKGSASPKILVSAEHVGSGASTALHHVGLHPFQASESESSKPSGRKHILHPQDMQPAVGLQKGLSRVPTDECLKNPLGVMQKSRQACPDQPPAPPWVAPTVHDAKSRDASWDRFYPREPPGGSLPLQAHPSPYASVDVPPASALAIDVELRKPVRRVSVAPFGTDRDVPELSAAPVEPCRERSARLPLRLCSSENQKRLEEKLPSRDGPGFGHVLVLTSNKLATPDAKSETTGAQAVAGGDAAAGGPKEAKPVEAKAVTTRFSQRAASRLGSHTSASHTSAAVTSAPLSARDYPAKREAARALQAPATDPAGKRESRPMLQSARSSRASRAKENPSATQADLDKPEWAKACEKHHQALQQEIRRMEQNSSALEQKLKQRASLTNGPSTTSARK